MKTKKPKPPAGLSAAARKLWSEIQSGYSVRDPAGLSILTEALRAYDRAEEARKLLDKQGCVVRDRWGQTKPHPAGPVERDSRAAFLAGLKALRVDIPTEPDSDRGED